MGRRRRYAALLFTLAALGVFWSCAPLPPQSLTVPLAVLSGPFAFLYYTRFAADSADVWGLLS